MIARMKSATMNAHCIALDWGTSSLRAYVLSTQGDVLAKQRSDLGILKSQEFRATLEGICKPWDVLFGKLPCLASGMIGSKQGWVDAGYLPTPCGFESLAGAAKDLSALANRKLLVMPGLRHIDQATNTSDVMRGEETQVFGAQIENGVAVLPGTHSKWVKVVDLKIVAFKTFMTGEAFSLFRHQSILAKLMPAENSSAFDIAAFEMGVGQSLSAPSELLHHLFKVRTHGLFNELTPTAQADFLSGVLIGSEVVGGRGLFAEDQSNIALIGEAALIERYRIALNCAGLGSRVIESKTPVAALGLYEVSKRLLDHAEDSRF
jgi:2-dehydro-3-deoxygalactonokinase